MQAPEQAIDVLDELVSIPHSPTAAPRNDANGHHTIVMPQNGAEQFEVHSNYSAQVLLTSIPLVAADLLSLSSSILLAAAVSDFFGSSLEPSFTLVLVSFSGAFFAVCALLGLYPGTGINPIVELRRISIALTLLFTVFFASSVVSSVRPSLYACLAGAYLFALFFTPMLRSFARSLFSRFRWWGQPVVIFGGGTAGAANYRHLVSYPRLGLRPVGIIDDLPLSWHGRPPESYGYGHPEKARALAKQHNVFWAVVAVPERSPSEVHELVKTYLSDFPHMLFVPEMDGLPSLWNSSYDWGGLHGIRMKSNLLLPLPRLLKRVMDLAIVIVGGLLSLPLIALIAVLIKMSSSGQVIYRQLRIGYNGRRFHAWKFRTMFDNADQVLDKYLADDSKLREEWEKNHKLRNDPRITRIGRWLRRTSLDELPQLWNILIGEMSLVGPRPIVNAEIARYGKNFDLFTMVRPGLSGLWQISGRNNTSYAERVRLDGYYVRNWSPWMDLYILARTFGVVLRGDGAY